MRQYRGAGCVSPRTGDERRESGGLRGWGGRRAASAGVVADANRHRCGPAAKSSETTEGPSVTAAENCPTLGARPVASGGAKFAAARRKRFPMGSVRLDTDLPIEVESVPPNLRRRRLLGSSGARRRGG
jgi:hypothetical protein